MARSFGVRRLVVAVASLVPGLSFAIASQVDAVAPSVTVGPVNAATNGASNFDAQGKWIGDGPASVPITFTGFDSAPNLFVSLSVPAEGAQFADGTNAGVLSVDTVGMGASITRAAGYNSWTNVQSVSFSGSRADVAALLASKVTWALPSQGGAYALKVSITEFATGMFYNPQNDHFYKVVTSGSNISWTNANAAASASTYNGLTGYLATITSRNENDYIQNYVAAENVWIGASDNAVEGTWKWVTGPEAGTHFWTGQGSNGTIPAGKFAYWAKNEPNDFFGEDYAVTNFGSLNGRWNDFPNGHSIRNYLVEYGGIGTYSGLRADGSATVTTSQPFTIGTYSGSTFTAGDIVWSASTIKPFGIEVSRFGSATSANFTATLTLNGSGMGTLTAVQTTGLTHNSGYSSFIAQTSLSFTGTRANVIAALKNLQWNTPSTRKDLEVTVALGETDTDFYLNPSNGHYYRLVTNSQTWQMARTYASMGSYKGMRGYLATITTAAENEFIKSKIPGTNIWIGATDAEDYVNDKAMIQRDGTEGRWTWSTGPEAGTQFWSGAANGATVSGQYASWRSGEPSNSSDGCGWFQSCNYRDEDYAYTNASGALGLWNDVWNGSGVGRYLIEYGGYANEASTARSAVATVGLGRVPSAPQSVTRASNSVKSATISWSAPADDGNRPITGYTVTASPDGATCTTTGATSCTISGLSKPAYTFTVAATNSVGKGAASAATSSLTILTNGEPGAPTNVKAAVSGGAVTISFGVPDDLGTTPITRYDVTAYAGATAFGTLCTTATLSCTFQSAVGDATKLTPTTVYTFEVTATNTGGTSTPSARTVEVAPNANTTAPGTPTNIQASVPSGGSAVVRFDAPANTGSSPIESYLVTARDAQGNIGGTCVAYAPATTCTVTGLDPSKNYTFTVVASNGNGSSSQSQSSVVVVAGMVTTAPEAPTNIQASVAQNGSVTVSFDPPSSSGSSSIVRYTVSAYDDQGQRVGSCEAIPPATSCVISNLPSGVTYRFDVVAHSGNDSSIASEQSVGVDPAQPTSAPSAPTNVQVSVGADGSATVSFDPSASPGTTSIQNYTATAYAGNTPIANATCTTASTSCVISNIPPGTNFSVSVVASNSNSDSSSSSASLVVNSSVATTNPGLPTNIQASVLNGVVTVAFTPGAAGSSPTTRYIVTAYNSTGVAVATCEATPPATSCSFNNLNAAESYTFTVSAQSGNGSSGQSNASIAVDPAVNTVAPAQPTNVRTAVVGSGTVRVSFDVPATPGSSPIARYIISAFDANGNVVGTCEAISPATQCDISGLSAGVSYSFSVVAANGNGNSSASAASSVSLPAASNSSVGSPTSQATPTTIASTQKASSTPSPGKKVASVSILIDVKIGDNLNSMNAPIRVTASGLKPGSTVLAIVQSTPRVFDRAVVKANGTISKTFWLPTDLEPGAHKVIIRVVDAAGKTQNFEARFELDASGELTKKATSTSLLPSVLPATGSDTSSFWLLGLILLALGGSVLVRRRSMGEVR